MLTVRRHVLYSSEGTSAWVVTWENFKMRWSREFVTKGDTSGRRRVGRGGFSKTDTRSPARLELSERILKTWVSLGNSF